jgi:hypothetical protein
MTMSRFEEWFEAGQISVILVVVIANAKFIFNTIQLGRTKIGTSLSHFLSRIIENQNSDFVMHAITQTDI